MNRRITALMVNDEIQSPHTESTQAEIAAKEKYESKEEYLDYMRKYDLPLHEKIPVNSSTYH